MTKNGLTGWIRQNAWSIIFFVGVTIAGYATLNAKVLAMETQLAKYPSMDYFELKFETVDEQLVTLQGQVNELKVEIRATK
jgi:hypothetical protein